MTAKKRRNVLIRLWLGFWHSVTALRIAVFNILFLLALALVIRVLFFSADEISIKDRTTLVIAPQGTIVEELTGTPMERALGETLGNNPPEALLRDILQALDEAATDKRIVQVLIATDQLFGLAPGMQVELAAAFDRFRQSGKPIYAWGGQMGLGQYMLASMADELWLHRDGFLLLDGYSSFRQYFAEGLDKLEVDVNLFRVGTYKSAMEPFIRNDMSEADREATEVWLSDLWQHWLERVALQRGIPLDMLVKLTDNFSDAVVAARGNIPQMALETGLVDRLATHEELRAELRKRGAPYARFNFRHIDFAEYVQHVSGPRSGSKRVGVIVARGSIVEGTQSPGTIGAESIARLIRKAARDASIQAVVLRIDSGGGSAFASEQIRTELELLEEAGKPLIVSMGNVAASGGYWIAMGADEVWAYPTTLTGSIGIFGFFPTFQNSLGRLGIHTDGVGTTPLSGIFRVDRELAPDAHRLLQSRIEHGYVDFIALVAHHRGMDPVEVDDVAQGRVWTGRQAQQHGLVDQLGTLEQAIGAAARRAGLADEYEVVYVEEELGLFEQMFVEMAGASIRLSGFKPSHRLSALWPDNSLRSLVQSLQQAFEAAQMGQPGIMAHCLCEAPL